MFWRRQENVEEMMARYFEHCDSCYEHFEKTMSLFFDEGVCEAFNAGVEEVHRLESECDDQRRQVEYTLYGKALLPESRGDLLGLLETYDKLPNIAETVCYALSCQQVVLPEALIAGYQDLFRLNVESYRLARKAVDVLMTNPKVALHATKAIEAKESESDRAERRLIREIFGGSWSTGDKLLYRDIVLLLGEVSDRAERLADRVGITAIKRQI